MIKKVDFHCLIENTYIKHFMELMKKLIIFLNMPMRMIEDMLMKELSGIMISINLYLLLMFEIIYIYISK
jgi:hypothetical protein